MSGQNGPGPAAEEAARLEAALARIARAWSRRAAAPHPVAAALHTTAAHATTEAGGPDTAEIAARLDSLIAEIRALLRAQDS
jgi:hypothetical protein